MTLLPLCLLVVVSTALAIRLEMERRPYYTWNTDPPGEQDGTKRNFKSWEGQRGKSYALSGKKDAPGVEKRPYYTWHTKRGDYPPIDKPDGRDIPKRSFKGWQGQRGKFYSWSGKRKEQGVEKRPYYTWHTKRGRNPAVGQLQGRILQKRSFKGWEGRRGRFYSLGKRDRGLQGEESGFYYGSDPRGGLRRPFRVKLVMR